MSISNCTAHQKKWQHWHINPAQAQAFYSEYFEGELPRGVRWHWVAGLQYCPRNWDYSYLVASDRGLEGILGRAGG